MFNEINKKLAFGCMRLPMIGEDVDLPQFKEMVDLFISEGFNYFDTAHGYINGKSELAIRDALTSRYPRESYILTDKLTEPYFNCENDIRPFFMQQLEWCGVKYFDFYLMHAQRHNNYEKFKACRAYETAFQLKKEGYIKHVGISFHDSAEVLERILTDYPEIEVVQLQFNYFDYNDPSVQSRLCYEVCEKHGKPVLVMEPVKGGSLVDITDAAKAVFAELGSYSPAAMAVRFAASFDNIACVLSGMSNIAQMRDNISAMRDFVPYSDEEFKAIDKVVEIIKSVPMIQCTSCRYCVEGCPKKIVIPSVFGAVNKVRQFGESEKWRYRHATKDSGKASDCISCGKCEKSCPQGLEIRKLLKEAAELFE